MKYVIEEYLPYHKYYEADGQPHYIYASRAAIRHWQPRSDGSSGCVNCGEPTETMCKLCRGFVCRPCITTMGWRWGCVACQEID